MLHDFKEGFRLQAHEDIAEDIMGGRSVNQRSEAAQPLQLGLGKDSHALPVDPAPLALLSELFAALPDARVSGRVLHRLPEVLLVALCAMVSDCEDFGANP